MNLSKKSCRLKYIVKYILRGETSTLHARKHFKTLEEAKEWFNNPNDSSIETVAVYKHEEIETLLDNH